MMSQQNVEIVRAFIDAYNRDQVDAALLLCTPDVEGHPASEFPESTPRFGQAALKGFLEEIGGAWSEPDQYVPTEVVAVGDERVLVRGDWRSRGAASAMQLSSGWSMVWTLRERKIARIAWFSDHNEALEAVGLSD